MKSIKINVQGRQTEKKKRYRDLTEQDFDNRRSEGGDAIVKAV